MASLNIRPRFALTGHAGNHLELTADTGCRIELFVLADDIVRVLVLPDGELHGPRTWAIAPGMEDTAVEGRERRDMSGFAETQYTVSNTAERVVVETACVRLDRRARRRILFVGSAARRYMASRAERPQDAGVQLRLVGLARVSLCRAPARRDVHRARRACGFARSREPELRDAQHRRDGLQRAHDRSPLQAHPVLCDVAAGEVDRLRPLLRHPRRLPLRHGPRTG